MLQINLENGSLESTSFPLLIKTIANRNETGMLSFEKDDQLKSIFFKDGKTIAAISNAPEEHLGEVMYQGGVYDEEVYDRLQLMIKEGGWRTPQVEEIVDVKTQKWWTRTVLREVFMSLVEWSEGRYSFTARKSPPGTQVNVEMDTEKLLVSILRRVRDVRVLARILGGPDAVLQINNSAFTGAAAKALTAEDGFFLSRIDGSLSVKDILAMGGTQKLDMLLCYINALMNGLLQHRPEPGSLPEPDPVRQPIEPKVTKPVTIEPEIDEEEPEALNFDKPEIDDSNDIMLTTDELKDLRKLAGKLDSDFLDLSKSLDLDAPKKKDEIDYNVKISYQRGSEFVESDGSDGAYDVDQLGRVTSLDEMAGDALGDRITLLIDGKAVDGEQDILGGGLSGEIFEAKDEEQQWNLFMISEEEMTRDFETDWTATWSDWVENTQELTKIQTQTTKLEEQLKAEKDVKLREEIIKDLKRQNAEMQLVINGKKRQIFSIHRRMQLMNHYELLRVSRDASLEKIQMAYDDWERDLSPDDSIIKEFSSIAPQINQIVSLLETAFKTLSHDDTRKEYDEKLVKQEASAERMKEKKALLAEDHLMSARTASRRGDQMLAMRFLRGSLSLDSSNPVYFQEMGHLLAQNQKWKKEALSFYHRAFHLDQENMDILYDVAELAVDLELFGFAKKTLGHIMHEKPTHIKAKRLMNKIRNQV